MRTILLVLALMVADSAAAQPRITVDHTGAPPDDRVTITVAQQAPLANPAVALRRVPTREQDMTKPKEYVAIAYPAGTQSPDTSYYYFFVPTAPRAMYELYLRYDGIATPGLRAGLFQVTRRPPSFLRDHPTVIGWLTLVAAYLVCLAFVSRDVRKLWRGEDGKPSTSKFQLVLWTGVILFVFSTIAGLYLVNNKPFNTESDCSLPENVWVVLGLSGITAVAAKGITTGHLGQRRVAQSAPGSPGGLITSDEGAPELMKIQLVTWTLVAIVIYLVQFIKSLGTLKLATMPGCEVPDIDTTLLVLMGLSQGTYLGKKLVTSDTPRMTSMSTSSGVTGTSVTINGAAFGDTQQGSVITIDNQPIASVPTAWTDGQIAFAIPSTMNGVPLAPGLHTVGLVVAGRGSVGNIPFVVQPNLTSTQPPTVPVANIAATPITLVGDTFGNAPGAVLVDQLPLPTTSVQSWSDKSIQLHLGATHPSGRAWAPGKISIAVSANGVTSTPKDLTIQ